MDTWQAKPGQLGRASKSILYSRAAPAGHVSLSACHTPKDLLISRQCLSVVFGRRYVRGDVKPCAVCHVGNTVHLRELCRLNKDFATKR